MPKAKIKSKLIAPCGMNCAICIGHLRDKNKCPGCNFQGKPNSDYCRKCLIKNCHIIRQKKWKHCSSKCEKFPCTRLKNLDKRYKNKYNMSMMENLKNIEQNGIRKFVNTEKIRWKCKKCGNLLCVHRDACIFCGVKRKK